jgi:hypothetical protein
MTWKEVLFALILKFCELSVFQGGQVFKTNELSFFTHTSHQYERSFFFFGEHETFLH